jgi:hypothetical protein
MTIDNDRLAFLGAGKDGDTNVAMATSNAATINFDFRRISLLL